ncbi:hypothetical protein QQ045_027244 [Rhodiola kirilowii]
MGLVNKMLYAYVISNITPRIQRHSILFIQDYVLVDKLLKMEKFSLPRMVMRHLEHVWKRDKHSLPYPGLLKKIMTFQKVYGKVDGEVMYFRKLDVVNLKRMHFRHEEGGSWAKVYVADVGVGDSESLEEYVPNTGLTLEDLKGSW